MNSLGENGPQPEVAEKHRESSALSSFFGDRESEQTIQVSEMPPSRVVPTDRSRPIRARRIWLATILGLAAVASVVAVIAANGDDSRSDGKNRQANGAATTSASSPNKAATPHQSAKPIVIDLMKKSNMLNFVRNYYSLLPGDLSAAWTKLGPGLQAQGFDAYRNWWSRFDRVSITATSADPAARTVTIELTARKASTRETVGDTEVLNLIRTSDGKGLLIDSGSVR
jgi:hypothetical protein